MKIIWTYTSNLEKNKNQGYAVAANNIIKTIDYDIEVVNLTEEDPFSFINIGYETRVNEKKISKKDIIINNTLPEGYTKAPGYSIGFTYWETTRLPNNWINSMNKMDEIWTASSFIREVFLNSGITSPIYSFKLGINEKIYKQINPFIKDKFVFIHDGSPSSRKNTQMVVDAFLKLFENNYNYHLIIKSIGPTNARIKNGQNIIGSVYNHNQITVVDENLSEYDVFNLYSKANCMLYPTSGEGWGMMPFQAIAMGIPTICTNFSACKEFAELSYPLDYQLSEQNMMGIYNQAGKWAMPDFDDLCDKMLYIVNNYEEAKAKTKIGSDYIQKNMKWSDVGKDYNDRLCQILNH